MKLNYLFPVALLSVASVTAMAATSQQQATTAAQSQLIGIDSASNGSAYVSGSYDTTQSTAMRMLKGSQNWFDMIHASLLVNGDTFAQSYYQVDTLQPGYTNTDLSGFGGFSYEARLNLDADPNAWIHAHLSLFSASGSPSSPTDTSTNTTGPFASSGDQPYGINGGYATRYYANSSVTTSGQIDVDEAYVTIENPTRSPLAVRAGRQYVAFGQYDLNAMMPTIYDQLVKTREEALTIGYYATQPGTFQGFSAQAYGFNGIQKSGASDGTSSNNLNTWGAAVGYANTVSPSNKAKLKLNAQIGYLSNLANVGILNEGLDYANDLAAGNDTGYYTKTVGAFAFDGTVHFGHVAQTNLNRFMLGAHYLLPTSSFDTTDFVNYNANDSTTSSAKPRAGTVIGGVTFMTMNHPSTFNLSYQWSDEAALYSNQTSSPSLIATLPKDRVAGEYDVTLLKHTMLGLEANWDKPYAYSDGGAYDNKNSLTGIARLSVLLS